MKYRLSMILFLIVTLPFAALAQAQATRIRVGYSSIGVGQCLVWVAKEAGLFKENGLDVQLIFIGSSSIMTQALIAGDVPIAIMSGSTAVGSQLAGSDLVIAASTKKDPAQAFLVTAKGISQPVQLKGKKLAVSRHGAYVRGDDGCEKDGVQRHVEHHGLRHRILEQRRYHNAKVYAGVARHRPTLHQRNDQGSQFSGREQKIFHGRYRPLHKEQRCREDRIRLRLCHENFFEEALYSYQRNSTGARRNRGKKPGGEDGES